MTDTSDARSRRWEATHQRIYDAAMALFTERGFDAVSVGQIAAAARVSVPTFYAHYPSKEHVIMQLPTAEDLAALLRGQPADLPVGSRLRAAAPVWFAQWTWEERAETLARWKIIASTPALRTRAALFERETAGYVADALPPAQAPLSAADSIIINAYLAAYTAGMLAWADGDGERKLEELVDEAFQVLDQG
ncbi:MAG TPA: helix-turn-helix domain-containing protein [Blastococcus sp.]|nr:helix-turn-helix domain-containing protein [Blastococcus sp.]